MAKILPFFQEYLFPDYKNAIRFTSTTNRFDFFYSITANFNQTGANSNYQTVNFNWNDGLEATIKVILPSGANLHDWLGYNYMHVVDDYIPTNNQQFFYFITKAKIVNTDVIEYTLVMDVFSTYMPYLEMKEAVKTERKHCNRFKKVFTGDDTRYVFRSEDAMLGDELDLLFKAQIPPSDDNEFVYPTFEYFDKESTVPEAITGDPQFRYKVNRALSDTLWLYAFILPPEEEKKGTLIYNAVSTPYRADVDMGVRVLFAPFKTMFLRNNKLASPVDHMWDAETLMEMVNNDTTFNARVVALRVSPMSPFNSNIQFNKTGDTQYFDFYSNYLRINYESVYTNDHYDRDIGFNSATDPFFVVCGVGSTNSKWGDNEHYMLGIQRLMVRQKDGRLVRTYPMETDLPIWTTSGLPTNSTQKSFSHEPKLYTLPYKRVEISTGYSLPKDYNELYLSGNDFDFMDLNTVNKFVFECSDIPTATDQKYTYYFYSGWNNKYYSNQLKTINGLVGNNLYELPTKRDQFAEYVANHTNYAITGLAVPLAQSTVSLLGNAVNKNLGGAVGNITDMLASTINFFAMKDDLERAPDTLKATGNNFLHDIMNNSNLLKLKAITYSLTKEQTDMVLDYFYEYGYKINRDALWLPSDSASFPTGFTKHDALFNRSRFNYVKLVDDDLMRKIWLDEGKIMPISAKQEMARVLNNGIRIIECGATGLITRENFNITYENMEKSI